MTSNRSLPPYFCSKLYGITPDGIGAPLILASADMAFSCGIGVLQFRSKHIVGAAKDRLVRELLAMANFHGKALIINDDASLVKLVGAHGVHLGSSDGDIAKARALLGSDAILGASCYGDLTLARAAVAQGASYIAFGALFASSTKPHAPRADLVLFKQAAALGVPTVGIGGITVSNAGSVIDAGASAVAVINELFPQMGEHTFTSYIKQVKHNTESFLSLLNTTH